jgi:uncharacterized protein (TIGR03067 family)
MSPPVAFSSTSTGGLTSRRSPKPVRVFMREAPMTRTLLAASTLFVLILATVCQAEDPPARADPAGKLTKDELDKMLAKLGYETKPLGKSFTEVTLERSEWTSVIRTSLSTDNTHIWFDVYLLTVNHPEEVPAAVWKKLLAKNEEVSPAVFSFNKTNKRIYLSCSIANTEVTPILLRKELEFLDRWVEKTYDVWKLSNFVPPMSEEGEKELGRLSGTWKVSEYNEHGKQLTAEEADKFSLTINKNTFKLMKDGKNVRSGQLVAGAGRGAKHLDRYDTGGSVLGIFKLDDDTLTWCFSPGERPTKFAGDMKTLTTVLILKREK